MADDTSTSTTSDPRLDAIINQLLAGKTAQPAVDPNTGPSSRDGRTILSLLGEGLGGGSQYGSTAEREQGGISALGALGSRMLQASDWSSQPHTFGSILGQGLDAARGNLGQTQAVSAARQYAAQQLAHQQQEDQINRLREALPYLSLQQQLTGSANTQKLLSGNTSIGAAGDGTYVGAIGGHEGTGQNPGSSAAGTGQFLRDTWLDFAKANPQYFQGMSEKQILDSRTVPEFSKKVGPVAIEWLAKQNADALTNAGVPPAGPVLGIAHYVGAGAAANIAKAPDSTPVARFVGQAALDANPELRTMTVGQMKARYANTPNPSFMSAPAPGQAGTPAPASLTPSAPGAKTQIPPPTAAAPGAPGQATPPARGATIPSEPPLLAGGAQAAGGPGAPGAPTSGVIPTLPPAAAAASAADVAQIEAGRAEARANPITPGAQPGAVVTAQAGGQQPTSQLPPIKAGEGLIQHPGAYKDYFTREAAPVPTTEDFSPNLSPARQAQFNEARQGIQQRIANRMNLPAAAQGPEGTKIIEDRAALEASIQKEMADKSQAAAANTTAWIKTQDAAVRPRYEQELKDYGTAAQSNLAQQQALDLEAEKGKQSRLSTAAGAEVERGKAVKEALDKDSIAASGQAQSLGGLQALSDNVDDSHTTLQSLATIKYGGTSLLNHLTNAGIVGKGDAGPIQMLQSGISGAITQLRARRGYRWALCRIADLSFIESMGPSLYEDKATRTAVIKYLQQAAYAKMRFNTIYNEEITRPGTNPADALERSRNIMDAKHPIVPQMTPEVAAVWNDQTPEAKAARTKWAASNNVRQNSLVRQPDGSLMLLK